MAKTALTQFKGPALTSADAGTLIANASRAARGMGATGRPNTFRNSGRTLLRFSNSNETNAADTYAVIRSREISDQGFYNHVVVLIPKNSVELAGPFPVGRFGAEVEVYYTSNAPDRNLVGDGVNGFQSTGSLADLGTEVTANAAAELTVEVLG